jgi:hypothetical protein
MTSNEREGLRLVGVYTADKFRLWALAGPSKATCRVHIMSAILGRKAKRAECGVFAIQSVFQALLPSSECRASWDDKFAMWARAELGLPVADWEKRLHGDRSVVTPLGCGV